MIDAKSVLTEWAPELAKRLGRPEAEILAKGLSAYDFSSSRSIEIKFADGSHARFSFAFAIVSQERHAVAVFTEHCGYLVFPLLPEMQVIQVNEDVYWHE
jgi:hypothetical protein